VGTMMMAIGYSIRIHGVDIFAFFVNFIPFLFSLLFVLPHYLSYRQKYLQSFSFFSLSPELSNFSTQCFPHYIKWVSIVVHKISCCIQLI